MLYSALVLRASLRFCESRKERLGVVATSLESAQNKIVEAMHKKLYSALLALLNEMRTAIADKSKFDSVRENISHIVKFMEPRPDDLNLKEIMSPEAFEGLCKWHEHHSGISQVFSDVVSALSAVTIDVTSKGFINLFSLTGESFKDCHCNHHWSLY